MTFRETFQMLVIVVCAAAGFWILGYQSGQNAFGTQFISVELRHMVALEHTDTVKEKERLDKMLLEMMDRIAPDPGNEPYGPKPKHAPRTEQEI